MASRDFDPIDLLGRKVLVTGASSGIGKATAVYLSRLGAHLVLNGRNEDRLNATLMELEGQGHRTIVADLALVEDLGGVFDRITDDGMKLSGIVHCAGIPFVMPLQSLTKKRLSHVMENNYFPFVELVRQYAKRKYSCGGSIVCISSITSVQPRAHEAGYIASKAAMNATVAALAFELAKKGIRINGVLAGNIMTEMARKSLEEYGPDNLKRIESSLLGPGEPDDIASVCAFLLSGMSRFITGRMLYADGGLL